MVEYTTTILRFEGAGDKKGWTYIVIPADVADTLNPGNKKSFKVKGKLDQYKFSNKSVLPIGGGRFMMPLDATIRKQIHKAKGAMLQVQLEFDKTTFKIPDWMLECLEDEPVAKERFFQMTKSFQKYYINWVDSARTDHTRTKRIAQIVTSLAMGLDFGGMIRMNRDDERYGV